MRLFPSTLYRRLHVAWTVRRYAGVDFCDSTVVLSLCASATPRALARGSTVALKARVQVSALVLLGLDERLRRGRPKLRGYREWNPSPPETPEQRTAP